jgi:hypothetical protein
MQEIEFDPVDVAAAGALGEPGPPRFYDSRAKGKCPCRCCC